MISIFAPLFSSVFQCVAFLLQAKELTRTWFDKWHEAQELLIVSGLYLPVRML